MKYLYLFGAILLVWAISTQVEERERVDEGSITTTANVPADAFVPSSTALAPSPAPTGGEATVEAREERQLEVSSPAPATATVVSTRTHAREAMTVEPTVVVTAVPTVAPVATYAPQSNNLSGWLAASPWPQSLWGHVRCIVARESGGNPGVTGGAGEAGLTQVHPVHAGRVASLGYSWNALYRPVVNLTVAYDLYLDAGFSPWRGGC